MKECLDTCGYEKTDAKMVQVKPAIKADMWIKELKKSLDKDVQMVVLLLPG